jgi:hypothetical protein
MTQHTPKRRDWTLGTGELWNRIEELQQQRDELREKLLKAEKDAELWGKRCVRDAIKTEEAVKQRDELLADMQRIVDAYANLHDEGALLVAVTTAKEAIAKFQGDV